MVLLSPEGDFVRRIDWVVQPRAVLFQVAYVRARPAGTGYILGVRDFLHCHWAMRGLMFNGRGWVFSSAARVSLMAGATE
ncbi:hypothetical protein DL237_00195 [Pseudooceanicola sediminis]|uniref:Uncharacterized protein n=1 Tax=Pseudooceanicola sediminis TaxID=2211117 RepID=A0A399J4U8_9RHOB|nr:hypothetical protein DL237_00195 [Pseudooceanicola sediminis]|tara:strand:+ start:70637 stop:70876 length:240 start_codon:yes stop_codon:yes gene_type:complete